jgi:hypothetical protein
MGSNAHVIAMAEKITRMEVLGEKIHWPRYIKIILSCLRKTEATIFYIEYNKIQNSCSSYIYQKNL